MKKSLFILMKSTLRSCPFPYEIYVDLESACKRRAYLEQQPRPKGTSYSIIAAPVMELKEAE